MRIWFIPRRYYIFAIFPLLLLISFTLSKVIAGENNTRTVVIDAGHGGVDSGANRPGIIEKDINLAVALKVRDLLEKQQIKVSLTREADCELSGMCDNNKVKGRYHRDLNARVEVCGEAAADLFVSIHANAGEAKRRGIECYYAPKSEESKLLAVAIEEQLKLVAPISQKAKQGNFFVLRRNNVPAVLIEVGFITHKEERALLENNEYQQKLAEAIANGILNYYH